MVVARAAGFFGRSLCALTRRNKARTTDGDELEL